MQALSRQDIQVAGIGISTSESQVMVLDRKQVGCALRVYGQPLCQVEEFKCLRILFTRKKKIDRRIGAASEVM